MPFCRFREAECHNCGRKGHIAPICRAKKAPSKRKIPRKAGSQKTKWVSADAGSASETEELQLFTIGAKATTPITVALAFNGKQLIMEVDTGAAVSIMSEHSLKAIVPDATL